MSCAALSARLGQCLVMLCLLASVRMSAAANCAGLPQALGDTVWPISCQGAAANTVCAGECRPGRGGPNLPRSTCQGSGAWSAPTGACLRVCVCAPPSVVNATWPGCAGVTLVGQRCLGSCPPATPYGAASIACATNGWDASSVVGRCSAEPVCSGARPVLTNAVWPTSCLGSTAGSVCQASCRIGYGPGASVSCHTSGAWSTVTGKCNKVCTESLPAVPSLVWGNCVSTTPVGQLCTGACNATAPNGGGSIRCTANGWTGLVAGCSATPVCSSPPPVPTNGVFPAYCRFLAQGQSCSGVCNRGYGPGVTATCDAGGESWTGNGRCQKVCMGPPPEIPDVQWDAAARSNGTVVGQLANGSCSAAAPYGGVTVPCTAQGWDTNGIVGRCSESPVCTSLPSALTNGRWLPSSCIGTPVGSTCAPVCNDGYVAGASAACNADLSWSVSGTCAKIYLGDMQVLLTNPLPDLYEYITNGWNKETPLCVGPQTYESFWTGVSCLDPISKPGVVDGLYLSQVPVTGTLPFGWSELKEVQEIDLSYNNLQGTLPSSWGKLQVPAYTET